MAELIWRIRGGAGPGTYRGDRWWVVPLGGVGAILVGGVATVSLQAACGLVLVLLVLALYQHDRRWGIAALFALWFTAPFVRRLLGLATGYVGSDPLSVAPFAATAVVAAIELLRADIPTRIRRILLLAAAGFTIGLPIGLLHPQSGLYAFLAYLAGLSGAVLGLSEGPSLQRSTLRRVLLVGVVPIALYAIVLQRILPLPHWDQFWLDSIDFDSIGASGGHVRVFGTLNAPGTLAPLLGLSLLCYLTIARPRFIVLVSAVVVLVALSLTYVRSAWIALLAGGLAHVIASRGRSARPVFGAAAVTVAVTLALAPVNSTARSVLDRFNTVGNLSIDTSANARQTTFSQTLPTALEAPAGHGLGSAGEPSKLNPSSALLIADNGYLALMYQVGPIGFALVIAAIGLIARAAWQGARARAPGQDLRLLLFAMLVYLLVALWSGDYLYGALGLTFWFIAGHVLALDHRRRVATARSGQEAQRSSRPSVPV